MVATDNIGNAATWNSFVQDKRAWTPNQPIDKYTMALKQGHTPQYGSFFSRSGAILRSKSRTPRLMFDATGCKRQPLKETASCHQIRESGCEALHVSCLQSTGPTVSINCFLQTMFKAQISRCSMKTALLTNDPTPSEIPHVNNLLRPVAITAQQSFPATLRETKDQKHDMDRSTTPD